MSITRKDWIWGVVALVCGAAGYAWSYREAAVERATGVAVRETLYQQTDELHSSTAQNYLLKSELSQFRGLIDGWNNLTEEQRQFFKRLLIEEKAMPPTTAPQAQGPR